MEWFIFIATTSFVTIAFQNDTKFEPCEDRYPQCKLWSTQNTCSSVTYKEYMMRTCPASCNLCKDSHPQHEVKASAPANHSLNAGQDQNVQPSFNSSVSNAIIPVEKVAIQSTNLSPSSTGSVKTSGDSTTLPQAMRLIQSLTQMISQTSAKKSQNDQTAYTASKRKTQIERSRKKNNLEKATGKQATHASATSRRAMVNIDQEQSEVDPNDETLKMIIQNRKRSQVIKKNKIPSVVKTTAHKRVSSAIHRGQKKNGKPKTLNIHRHRVIPIQTNQEIAMAQPVTTQIASIEEPIGIVDASASTIEVEDVPTEKGEESSTQTTAAAPPSPPQAPTPPTQAKASPATPQTTTYKYEDAETAPTTTTTTASPEPAQQAETEPTFDEEPQCEGDECGLHYSLVLRQQFDPDYKDTTSSKFSLLKGNLVQDLGYALGPDAVIFEIEFESTPSKNESESLTRVYFTLSGEKSKLEDLKEMVDKGNVNGLLVRPMSLSQE